MKKLVTSTFISLLFVLSIWSQEVEFDKSATKKGLKQASKIWKDESKLQFIDFEEEMHYGSKLYKKVVNQQNETIGYLCLSTAKGRFDYFDYFIFFSPELKVVSVKGFKYRSNHGAQIFAKGWLKQFIGYDGTQPLQKGKDVDAISGATLAVNAILMDIEEVTKILKSELK